MNTDKDMKYLVWSNQHQTWWLLNQRGYTPWIERAGRFNYATAAGIVADATCDGQLTKRVQDYDGTEITAVDEIMVLAPECLSHMDEAQQFTWLYRERGHRHTHHGHPCCGLAPPEARPSLVARCGGPALCPSCAVQAHSIHQGISQYWRQLRVVIVR